MTASRGNTNRSGINTDGVKVMTDIYGKIVCDPACVHGFKTCKWAKKSGDRYFPGAKCPYTKIFELLESMQEVSDDIE